MKCDESYVYVTLALLALMTGQAHAQRCLPE